uniref:Uncharacterized protein n=1 Tax=Romanomermis culicivorax TaxID=13658 RepID=A0A915HGY1_ROMCU
MCGLVVRSNFTLAEFTFEKYPTKCDPCRSISHSALEVCQIDKHNLALYKKSNMLKKDCTENSDWEHLLSKNFSNQTPFLTKFSMENIQYEEENSAKITRYQKIFALNQKCLSRGKKRCEGDELLDQNQCIHRKDK